MSVNSVSTNFNDLQKTQNSLLNDLKNMKSRVNKLLSRKMDVNTFIEMENKQYGLQLKLLNILNDIKVISQSNNVSSNDKNIVNDILIHFFKVMCIHILLIHFNLYHRMFGDIYFNILYIYNIILNGYIFS